MTTLLSQPAVPELQWGSLDGIQAIWSSAPGPFAAGIVFRVGRADEPLPHAGITHLAEHLALNRFGPQTYHANGSVDGAFTTFFATGDEETATDFVQHVIRNAARFDAARLGTEVKFVAAEARESGGLTVETKLLWARFGARGFGLLHAPEYATRVVDPRDVAAWAEHHFVRNNAAFWFTGTPPGWLEAPLPDGAWQLPPSLEPVPLASKPGVIRSGRGTVAISFLMPTNGTADMAVRVLERRAVALLQEDRGLCRRIEHRTLAVGADTSHVTIAAACTDELAPLVGKLLLDLIDDVISRGAPRPAIEMGTAFIAAEMADPGRRIDVVQSQARQLLLGGQPRNPEQVLEEWRALEPGAVASAMALGTRSMLMLLPESAAWKDQRLPLVQQPKRPSVDGRQFHPRPGGRPADGATELTVGADGVSIVAGKNGAWTVRFEDCVGLIDADQGGRVAIGRDGTTIRVEPSEWKDGNVAIEYLDRIIPRSLHVPLAVSVGV